MYKHSEINRKVTTTTTSLFHRHVTRPHHFLFYSSAVFPNKSKFSPFSRVDTPSKQTLAMAAGFGLCVQISIVFLCHVVYAADISCKNEAGEPVDW